MVDGQHDNLKIGAIIQARMRSSRLPGKILMPLPFPNGKPLMSWIIQSVRQSKYVTDIILATSSEAENDCLEKYAAVERVHLIRGSEEDVLSRFIHSTNRFDLDVVIRLTGDNPVVDVGLLDEAIKCHLDQVNDYTGTSGLPVGMNFEVISRKTLLELTNYSLTSEDREHVTLYIKNNARFKKFDFQFFKDENMSNLRLTVDYPSDLAAASLVLGFASDKLSGIALVRRLMQEHNWIFEINKPNEQRTPFTSPIDEIGAAIASLEKNGMARAASILKEHGLS